MSAMDSLRNQDQRTKTNNPVLAMIVQEVRDCPWAQGSLRVYFAPFDYNWVWSSLSPPFPPIY